jgi:hypothetical protein
MQSYHHCSYLFFFSVDFSAPPIKNDFSAPDNGKMKTFIVVGALVLLLLIFFYFRHSLVERLFGREDIKGTRYSFYLDTLCKS